MSPQPPPTRTTRRSTKAKGVSFQPTRGPDWVTRFLEHSNEMPWAWTPGHVDEFFGNLRSEHHLARSKDNEQDPKKRAFIREELHAFFDRADDEVDRIRSLGRKGWLPAFRDAMLLRPPTAGDCAATASAACNRRLSPSPHAKEIRPVGGPRRSPWQSPHRLGPASRRSTPTTKPEPC